MGDTVGAGGGRGTRTTRTGARAAGQYTRGTRVSFPASANNRGRARTGTIVRSAQPGQRAIMVNTANGNIRVAIPDLTVSG